MKRNSWFGVVLGILAPILCYPVSLEAWSWPARFPRLLNSFAEVVEDDWLRGVRIVHPPEDHVQSANSGSILIAHPATTSPISPPHALDSFVLIGHLDGTRTLYSNMGLLYRNSGAVLEGSPIGEAVGLPESAREFEFRILDSGDGGYLNPLLILPRDTDLLSPTVREISVQQLHSSALGEQIVVDIVALDRLTTSNPLRIMPFYWSIEYGGRRSSIFLNAFRERQGHLILLSSNRRIEDSIPRLWRARLGPLPYIDEGRAIRVIVGDHIGRYSIRSSRIETQPELE